MTSRRWRVAALMLVVFAESAAARQGRIGGDSGVRGGLSTARQAVTRGADGGEARGGDRHGAGPTRPAVLRGESPTPTPTATQQRPTVSPSTPPAAPRTDRFSYPPPSRSLANASGARQRAEAVRPVAATRTPSPSFRTGTTARYAVPRGSGARGGAGSSDAVARHGTSSYSPRYVASGWRIGSGSHIVVVPRYIHPRVLGVASYRPHCYRPNIGIGVVYGVGGFYPFGEIAPAYYDPLPDAVLGGVRITDAPREAQVFVDGAYVGIVDDFDGPGQHLNLEAGPHRIEIHTPASGAIAFDVMVEQGRTITVRASVH